MTTPALAVSHLSKHFPGPRSGLWSTPQPVVAVDDVSFAIAPGETFGLVGESGCGKSTVARCILGLLPPDGGSVALAGQPLLQLLRDPRARLYERVQIVFQDPYSSLNPRLRIGTTLVEPLLIQGRLGRAAAKARVGELLAEVGLPADAAGKFPHQLSGGQRQRIAIARALALEPSLLVADEPVSALDVSVQAQILALLETLRRSRGLSMLFISHDLGVVRNICDRVAVMYLGRIVEEGPTEQIFERPRHPYTSALRDSSLPPDASARARLNRIEGELPSALEPPPGCHFHPRCPQAMPRCATERPPWAATPDGGVACHLHPPDHQEGHP